MGDQAKLWNHREALIDYGQRRRAGQPISTAGTEGTVNQLVNARLNRGDQMRWSAQGAHRVLQVRAALLDGRLHAERLCCNFWTEQRVYDLVICFSLQIRTSTQ